MSDQIEKWLKEQNRYRWEELTKDLPIPINDSYSAPICCGTLKELNNSLAKLLALVRMYREANEIVWRNYEPHMTREEVGRLAFSAEERAERIVGGK